LTSTQLNLVRPTSYATRLSLQLGLTRFKAISSQLSVRANSLNIWPRPT